MSAKLADLQAKLEEQTRQKAEHIAAIADAKSRCGQFSRSDVARLQGQSLSLGLMSGTGADSCADEYQSLQGLHMWRVSAMSAHALELDIEGELALRFDCKDHIPVIGSARLSMFEMPKEAERVAGRSKKADKGKEERKAAMFRLLEAALEGLRAVGSSESLSQVSPDLVEAGKGSH